MNKVALGTSAIVAGLAVAAGAMFASTARSQVQAAPNFIPIGVSSAGNTSTVWFHEPSSRQALACQTVSQGGSLSSIQCVRTTLPH
jgi:hypothetical protein